MPTCFISRISCWSGQANYEKVLLYALKKFDRTQLVIVPAFREKMKKEQHQGAGHAIIVKMATVCFPMGQHMILNFRRTSLS